MADSQTVRTQCAQVAKAGEWLLKSGIQSGNGGVARYYRSDLESNMPISTEITGYIASALVYLFEKTGRRTYADRAMHTADFLADLAWDKELKTFPFEFPGRPPAYFFDCGIIARGLLAVWRMSGEDKYLKAAAATGESMLRDFDSGSDFTPIIQLPSKAPGPRNPRWSRSSGCYQLKAAMAWRELSDVTGDERFGRAFDRMLHFALEDDAKFLPGAEDENAVMDRLHPYCYYLEALASYGLDVKAGVERATDYLYRIRQRFVRSDVYSQLLRVKLLSGHGLATAAAEVSEIEKFQAVDEDPCDVRREGGFYFGAKAGKLTPYVNPVSTVFALQALEMWHEHQAGMLERDCRMII